VRRLVEVISRWRRAVAAGLTVLIATMLIGAMRVRVDNSLNVWFVDDDPALLSWLSFLERFGDEEMVVTVVRGTTPALSAQRLAHLALLSAELATVDGVARVQSLATLQPPLIIAPVDSTDIAAVRAAVSHSRIAAGLVGEDGASLVVRTLLEANATSDMRRPQILDELFTVVDTSLDGRETAHHGGIGVLHDALNRATLEEGTRFVLGAYLVIIAVLLIILRSWLWVGLAIGVVAAADLCLFGVMGLAGKPLNMISIALPALVMILGVANVVHLHMALSAVDIQAPSSVRRTALGVVAVPCALNTATTAAGFLSLGSASMAITRDYGMLAAFGVLLAFGMSIAGASLLLPRLRPAQRSPATTLAGVVSRVMVFSLDHRRLVGLGACALVVLALSGVRRLEVDTFSMDFLPRDHTYRRDSAAIEAALGAYIPLELTVSTADSGGWRNPTTLASLDAAQRLLEADAEIGPTVSVADVTADVIRSLRGTIAGWSEVTGADVKLALDWVRLAGGDAALSNLVADDDRTLRLSTTTRMGSAAQLSRTAGRILADLEAALGPQLQVALSGYLPLYNEMITHTLDDQVRSFGLAFAVVFGIIAVALRSWRLTVAAILPNVMPPLLVLGAMGHAGIRLDVATVTIAAAILGIVVDDTVHILYRLRSSLAASLSLKAAVQCTAQQTGVAICCTSLVFCAGFGVIATASVRSVSLVGLLTAIGVAGALLTDLLLLPAVLTWLYPHRLPRR
jgi:uncharacterized protein